MPDTCGRCGAPLIPLADLAEAALVALDAMRSMKLALPDRLTKNVARVARGLACHTGRCEPRT